MLSILIPTYEYTCYSLVYVLQQQLEALGHPYEILVCDDGGRDQVSSIANLKINELPNCRFVHEKENRGRAGVRNFLAGQAQGDWCLFIDADARVVTDHFVGNYLQAIQQDPVVDVWVGGLVNPPSLPSEHVTLRYRYEKACEYMRSVAFRQQHPYDHFSTFNFMIRRSVVLDIPFDEHCREYGFEDTLMGVELRQKGKRLTHIDNPLMHLGFDANPIFLRKTETSLRTLRQLGEPMLSQTTIGKTVATCRKWHLGGPIRLLFRVFGGAIRHNLEGNDPNLNLFKLYKLGYFLSLS